MVEVSVVMGKGYESPGFTISGTLEEVALALSNLPAPVIAEAVNIDNHLRAAAKAAGVLGATATVEQVQEHVEREATPAGQIQNRTAEIAALSTSAEATAFAKRNMSALQKDAELMAAWKSRKAELKAEGK